MDIRIFTNRVSRQELEEIAKEFYINMVKGVVDIEKEIIALGGEYHADANTVLIESGSKQSEIWGFNIYLDRGEDEGGIEYTSLINIRPAQGNRDMEVQDDKIKERMKKIIKRMTE